METGIDNLPPLSSLLSSPLLFNTLENVCEHLLGVDPPVLLHLDLAQAVLHGLDYIPDGLPPCRSG